MLKKEIKIREEKGKLAELGKKTKELCDFIDNYKSPSKKFLKEWSEETRKILKEKEII